MAAKPAASRFQVQKDRMLKAAAHCFNQKGYSGSSLKDVANMLGLTDAALYYYVRNKQELVYLCYVRAAELGDEALQSARRQGGSGLQQVQQYIRNQVEIMVGEQGPIAIMSEIQSLPPEHRDDVLALSRRHSSNFEKLLQTGIADGSIRDCDVRMTGNAIMGSINWIPKWYRGDAEVAEQVLEEFPRVLSAGLIA
jgi:AcrR family transcriptional regulator